MSGFIRHCIVTALLLTTVHQIRGQAPFQRDTIMVTEGTDTLGLAWAGGLNSVLFSNIDLNFDNEKDLVVFDRTNKILTFTSNAGNYKYEPAYEPLFPEVRSYMLLADYNCDGLPDLFTYFSGSIRLYKNTSSGGNLSFTLEKSQIMSYQAPNLLPVYSSTVDLPAIVDVDGDGDLDILSFGVSTTSVQMHRNRSMDLYGHCDSLDYELETTCWGKFAEGAASLQITLNACQKSTGRHGGSTLLAFDYDDDADLDMLLGDDGNDNLTFLRNGGDPHLAVMDSVSYLFPNPANPVDVPTFNAPSNVDVNGDGRMDLIVSPFAQNQSDNLNSVWLYLDTASTGAPQFKFITDEFLQRDMIDLGEGAYPVYFDYDIDGDDDLLVGNYGYRISAGNYRAQLALFENTGNNNDPVYNLVTRDFAAVSSLNVRNLYPAPGDLDGDGDKDLLIGIEDGTLLYFENTAPSGNPATFTFIQGGYAGIDVGANATPQLVDVNRDGKPDLVIGEKDGTLNYIPNTGTSAIPSFLPANMVSNFGGVSVAAPGWIFGYSTPCLFEINGSFRLLVGSENGRLHYYDNIDNNLSGNFNLVSDNYREIAVGVRTSATVSGVKSNGEGRLITGNYRAGLSAFKGNLYPGIQADGITGTAFKLFPNPAVSTVNIEVPGAGDVGVFTVTGQQVMQIRVPAGKIEVETGDLKPGIYLVIYSSGKGSAAEKLVVTN